MDQYGSNSLTDSILAHYGLSRNNPASLNLLTDLISSPQAIAAGFAPAYAGMPPNEPLNQQLVPVPQWTSVAFVSLGPPMGKTWYDALQTKVTKRFSHGLSAQASYVFSKATEDGIGAETGQFVTGLPVVEDIFNYGSNKELNQLNPPQALVISGSYITPKTPGDSVAAHVASRVLRDWQLGWLLRYQSGALLEAASSTNGLLGELARPQAGFGPGATNLDNANPGVPRLLVNPNCGCFNPETTVVLNTSAWTNPGPGQWGTSSPFYNGYRWQRQPAESMSFARNFPVKENRINIQFRAEFYNVFNRLFLSMPTTGATTTAPTTTANGIYGTVYNGGYGTIATVGGAGAQPRNGQLVLRVQF
jgi:hypothetical protein